MKVGHRHWHGFAAGAAVGFGTGVLLGSALARPAPKAPATGLFIFR